jgi:hypothetical protein
MAYKFSLGEYRHSGSMVAEHGLTVDAGTVSLPAGEIDNAELANSSVTVSAGDGLGGGGAVSLGGTVNLSINVDDSSIELNADSLRVKAAGITNDMLAGSIASTKIAELNAFDTADLSEGTNLYFTDARARAAISVTDAGGDGSMSYNSSTGVITYTGPSASEVRAHMSADDFLTYDASSGLISVAGAGFTGSARNVISVTDNGGDGSLSYDAGTGVISYTGPSAAEVRAHLSAGDGLDYLNGVFSADLKAAGGIKIVAGEMAIEPADFAGAALEDDGSDKLRVKALGITNSMLSGAIASSKIAEINAFDSDDLSEGSSNLYFTDARARAAISVTDAGGDGSMAYNSSTGVITYTGPSAAEVRAHLSVTDAGGDGSMSYDNSTGVFTYTGPSAAEVRAHMSVTDTDSMDMSFSAGAISADLKLSGSDALAVDASGLFLKSTIAGDRTFSNNVVISGDLTVNGSQTILNVATLEIEDDHILVGKGNTSLADADGSGIIIEAGVSDDLSLLWANSDDRMELKKGAGFADLKVNKLIGDVEGSLRISMNAIADANGTLQAGFNYGSTDLTAARTWTLPNAPLAGDIVYVKAPSNIDSTNHIIIQKGDASHSIDGLDNIVLESPFAAVNLVYVAANLWRVF